MLRKLVAAIAFLAVAVLPATALGQPHWFRGEETQVTVYVERTRVDATNWSSIKRAGAQWARSSRIRVVWVIPEGAGRVNGSCEVGISVGSLSAVVGGRPSARQRGQR